MELRHRVNRFDNMPEMETIEILPSSVDNKGEVSRKQKLLSTVATVLVASVVLVVLNVFVYYMNNRLPVTVDTNSTDNFVAKRAMLTLTKLANLGPRPVGSHENEILAFNLFKTEIEGVINEVGNVNNIEMFNQKVSGSFILDMKKWKYVLSYEDLQNVVVKLDPKKGGDDEAVLLNCHYDTAPVGPGVSDNGVNCAVMVELLRVLAKDPSLKRPVIFLFNGGEEIILQASHGFVTQHPWSKEAKYVINLDSCGAGGREIMFQTTKSNSYLLNLYARYVPHPYGQAIGEELFQSGIIPSDTDFRIFRDFGNMSGMDFAHYKNGYVYHTKYDDLDQIEPSVLQNTGENLLALTRAISMHNATVDRKIAVKYVFFDVLGLYMVSYTEMSGVIVNLVIVLVSFFSIFLSFRYTTVGMNRREYSMHLLATILSPSCAILLSIVSCLVVAFVLDAFGRSMSWYNYKINLTVYYATASLTLLSVTFFYPKNESRTIAQLTISALNGYQFVWTILLFVATMVGLRSSYVLAIVVLFPSAAGCVLGVVLNANRAPNAWIFVYALSTLVPAVFVLYLTQMFISLFAPITGRIGPDVNPDYVVAALLAVSTCATIGSLSSIVLLIKRPHAVLAGLGAMALLSAVVIVVSPFGFPYAEGPGNGRERFDAIHTHRTFHDFNRTVRFADTGYLIVNWDRHSTSGAVAEYVPGMSKAVRPDCDRELLCGVPLVGQLALHSTWIEAPKTDAFPSPAPQTAVELHNLGDGRRRAVFSLTAVPERINVYVSPYPGTDLTAWSFPGRPEPAIQWNGHDVYVIRHSSARVDGDSGSAWSFWLEQRSDAGFARPTINVTVACNWIVHKRLPPLDGGFEELVRSFPPWAHVNHGLATVDAFVY